ncbi:hypothetical protein NitaMp102 (mitochondrion) [Nicotiana tabacum]|uniref:Uncharacterized protein n=1 Tax=Nicotiana tabacum TaxID=4097 RepID=Q5M9X3_TOBAC|nr:hypothetical protein NitaMp102 [Nicotiana tabacum]UYX57526.1 hypothetical protein [Nicotiana tabacum]BAD83505.1 hypothetical protein [Nicotiana tabacum]
MPYHLAILHRPVLDGRNGERGKGEAGLEERAVQGRGDIASKQQGSPLRTDYNKLATLIERKGKLSALFACNAMPIKVGEGFCNLRLVTLFDGTRWLRVHRKSVTFVTVSIWYSLDSFNSSLKAFGVINRKPFRKKDII